MVTLTVHLREPRKAQNHYVCQVAFWTPRKRYFSYFNRFDR